MTEHEEKEPLQPVNGPQIQELPAETADKLSKLEEELALEKDRNLRLVAEFENFKKRNARDRIELLRFANEEIIVSLLPVLDDFERALKAEPENEGMKLIMQKLLTLLQQKGLKMMESLNTEFNPDLHDAVSQTEADEPSKNRVVEELAKGYYLNDKVIRHAKVIVGK